MEILSLFWDCKVPLGSSYKPTQIIVRKQPDGSFMAVGKAQSPDSPGMVVYGVGDNPAIALGRMVDASSKVERWRRDKYSDPF